MKLRMKKQVKKVLQNNVWYTNTSSKKVNELMEEK